LRQRVADGRQRVGRVGEQERHRRLRPNHDADVFETAGFGQLEILVEDLDAILRPPFLGLIDIGLNDAQADSGAVKCGRGEPALAPHIAKPKQCDEQAGERRATYAPAELGP